MNNNSVPLDYVNSLMYELEKAFWDERGKGARFRMTKVGGQYYEEKVKPLLQTAIVVIYNQAVPSHQSTARTSAVTVEERKGWFEEHEPTTYPIFVAERDGHVIGWCSLSVYRPGRAALRFTSEISYYVDQNHQRQGIGKALVQHALEEGPTLGIKTIIAVLIDRNVGSRRLLEKLGFQQWGYLPRVLDFNGEECGEYYYGKRVLD